MKKFICTVCGYIHEGDSAPEKCPLCKAPASKFKEMEETEGGLQFADEHVIGVAKGCDEEMIKDLNNHFMGECTEVGMYLAMSRQADREGYPEVAEAFKRYAWEEAEHAAKFAELLGDCVWDTKTNLEKRMNAESGACADKKRIATRAKALNLDAIHDTVHEMAKDEARLKLLTLTLSTIQFTKWLRTKLVTEKVSKVCTTDTSRNNILSTDRFMPGAPKGVPGIFLSQKKEIRFMPSEPSSTGSHLLSEPICSQSSRRN